MSSARTSKSSVVNLGIVAIDKDRKHRSGRQDNDTLEPDLLVLFITPDFVFVDQRTSTNTHLFFRRDSSYMLLVYD